MLKQQLWVFLDLLPEFVVAQTRNVDNRRTNFPRGSTFRNTDLEWTSPQIPRTEARPLACKQNGSENENMYHPKYGSMMENMAHSGDPRGSFSERNLTKYGMVHIFVLRAILLSHHVSSVVPPLSVRAVVHSRSVFLK